MIEDIAEIVASALHVDRHPHCPCLGDREQQRQRAWTVTHHQGDAVTGRHARTPQVDCKPARRSFELAERDRCAAKDGEAGGTPLGILDSPLP